MKRALHGMQITYTNENASHTKDVAITTWVTFRNTYIISQIHILNISPMPNHSRTCIAAGTLAFVPFVVLGVPFVALGVPFVALSVPFVALGVPFVVLGVPFVALGVPFVALGVPFVALGVLGVALGVVLLDAVCAVMTRKNQRALEDDSQM